MQNIYQQTLQLILESKFTTVASLLQQYMKMEWPNCKTKEMNVQGFIYYAFFFFAKLQYEVFLEEKTQKERLRNGEQWQVLINASVLYKL